MLKRFIPASRAQNENGKDESLTLEQLKAGTQGKSAAEIAKDLDRDISELKKAHRVNADTLKEQISL